MQLEIRVIGMEATATMMSQVERDVGFALGRFYSRIARLTVQLTDVDGPHGGSGKVCSVEAQGDFGILLSEAQGADLQAVTLRALGLMERRVARAVHRAHDRSTPLAVAAPGGAYRTPRRSPR